MELGQNANNWRLRRAESALCKSPVLHPILGSVFHLWHWLDWLRGKKSLSTLQYQNIPSSFTVHAAPGYNLQSFKEHKPKDASVMQYGFQTSLGRLFINYEHKHAEFPRGLLPDDLSLGIYL